MNLLSVENLSKSYSEKILFNSISFGIAARIVTDGCDGSLAVGKVPRMHGIVSKNAMQQRATGAAALQGRLASSRSTGRCELRVSAAVVPLATPCMPC